MIGTTHIDHTPPPPPNPCRTPQHFAKPNTSPPYLRSLLGKKIWDIDEKIQQRTVEYGQDVLKNLSRDD